MKELMLKFKIINILICFCIILAIITLFISATYTYLFFTAGIAIFTIQFLIRILLTLIFEGVKSLMIFVNIYNKSKKVKIITNVLIIISVVFTINSFLNDIDTEKEDKKYIREEYKNIQNKIIENDIEIQRKRKDLYDKQTEIKTQEKYKNEELKNCAIWQEKIKIVITEKYDKKIKSMKIEEENILKDEKNLKKYKKELEGNLGKEKKYAYKVSNSINTKILDAVVGENSLNRIFISIFMAILIESMYYLLVAVIIKILKDVSRETLEKINLLNNQENIINKAATIAKAAAICKKIEIGKNKNNDQLDDTPKNEKNKNLTLFKNTDLSNLSIKIIEKAIENDNKVPSFAKLAFMLDTSKTQIEKSIKELKESYKIKKEGKFYYLVGVNHEKNTAN